MKKLLAVVIAMTVCLSCFAFTGCQDRSTLLKLYMPGEYIDSDIFEEFSEWYYEETGKEVKVVLNTFDAVEEIITAVEKAQTDYDLLCPSDYAVERLIKKDLLIEVDKDIIDVEDVILPAYVDRAKISDPELKYSVPYMYGTFGIMYNYKEVGEHITSWDAIFTDKYGAGISANKDSLREAITSAAIYANKDELKTLSNNFTDYDNEAYQAKLQSIYTDFSSSAIDSAIEVLNNMKSIHNESWGGESLKFDLATNKGKVKIALMWSCDAGYVMNDYEDDNGVEYEGNKDMWYVIPEEGGNIYLDNFVINKYAKNVDAAQYFLKFICQKEIAIMNSEYAGAISPVEEAYNELYDEYFNDETIGEGAEAGWREMYLDMLFPSEETLKRCGTMIDFGDADSDITNKWINVKK